MVMLSHNATWIDGLESGAVIDSCGFPSGIMTTMFLLAENANLQVKG